MRTEDPRPEPDIEWPGLAADSDGRSIVARMISTGAFLRVIAEAVVPAQWTRERQELLASDTLTPASRHSVTAGESCDGSTVADLCDVAWL